MRESMRTALGAMASCLVILVVGGCTSAPVEVETDEPVDPRVMSELDGRWEGSVKAVGHEYKLIVVFDTDPELAGIMDIPEQDKTGLDLESIWFRPPTVHFELDTNGDMARFEGDLSDGEISGKYTQGPVKGTFSLKSVG
jgi:hypothetical protein